MKTFPWVVLFLLVFCPSLWAGEIYGNIQEGRKSVGAGTKVEIRCGQRVHSSTTDRYGSYRLFSPEKGKCAFTVYYKELAPSLEIYSYEGSTRYDWVLEKRGDQYVLRRK